MRARIRHAARSATTILRARAPASALASALAIALPIVAASTPAIAHDAGAAPDIAVRVAVVGACTDAPSFAGGLVSRSPRLRVAAPGEVGRVVQVQITPRGARFVGAVAIDFAPPRLLEAGSCEDLVSALSFVAAVALDPTFTASPATPSSASSSAKPAPSASPSIAPPPPPPPPPASTVDEPVRSPDPQDNPENAAWTIARGGTDRAPPRARTSWEATETLEIAHAGGLGAVIDERLGGALLSAQAGPWAPSVSLTFSRSFAAQTTSAGGAARFQWLTATIEGCALRFDRGPVSLRPCVGIRGGMLQAEWSTTDAYGTRSEDWLSVRMLVRGELPILRWLILQAQLGAEVPIFRDRFTFAAAAPPTYRAPWALPLVGLGLGARFP